jgi:hypothetical protein
VCVCVLCAAVHPGGRDLSIHGGALLPVGLTRRSVPMHVSSVSGWQS